MYKEECGECGKTIQGYHKDHVDYLMKQHYLKHENEKNRREQRRSNQQDV